MNHQWTKSAYAAALVLLAGCAPHAPTVEEIPFPRSTAEAQDPALARDPVTGDLLATWIGGREGAWQVYLARSGDGGTTWSEGVRVTTQPNDAQPQGESAPRLVAAPGALVVIWATSAAVAGRRWPASNLRFTRSVDGGRTWTPAVTLNDDTAAAPGGHSFHGAAWVGDSGVAVAWLDERGGAAIGTNLAGAHPGHHVDATAGEDATIYAAWSPDLGRTWGPNHALWPATCPCCRISLARGPDGQATAAWRMHFPGEIRDVVAAPLDPAAPAPTRVHADGWAFPGCPDTGPGVAVGPDGAVHVAWYTGKPDAPGVYYARAAGPGRGFTTPIPIAARAGFPNTHTAVAVLGSGAVVAYDVGPHGDHALVVTGVRRDGTAGGTAVLPGSVGADRPQLVALDATHALVAWTSIGDGPPRVRLARITFADPGPREP